MFGAAAQHRQADNIITLVTLAGFSPFEALQMATGNAAQVLAWSGGMSPYRDGALGVVQVGAYADLILVDGNPLEDIQVLSRDHVCIVVKDGVCYKYQMPANRASGLAPQLRQ